MSRKLSPEDKKRIIDLKLQRIPEPTITEQIACTASQVSATWLEYLRDKSNSEVLKNLSQEAISRMEQIAVDARRAYQRATRDGDHRVASAYLREERAALENLHRYASQDNVASISSTLSEVVSGENRVASLRAIRDQLAARMNTCDPREAVGLARQLVSVIAELDELREARSDGIDELRARRTSRLADAARSVESSQS